jgi:hypothetical protein
MIDGNADPRLILEALMDHVDHLKKQRERDLLNGSLEILFRSRSLLHGEVPQSAGGEGSGPSAMLVNEDGYAHTAVVAGGAFTTAMITAKSKSEAATSALSAISDAMDKFRTPWMHFEPFGTSGSERVPAYLKSNSRVQNLFLSYRDTVAFVREISAAKIVSDRQRDKEAKQREDERERIKLALEMAHSSLTAHDKAEKDEHLGEGERATEGLECVIDVSAEAGASGADASGKRSVSFLTEIGADSVAEQSSVVQKSSTAASAPGGFGIVAAAMAASAAANALRAKTLRVLPSSRLRHSEVIEPDKEPFTVYFEAFLKVRSVTGYSGINILVL